MPSKASQYRTALIISTPSGKKLKTKARDPLTLRKYIRTLLADLDEPFSIVDDTTGVEFKIRYTGKFELLEASECVM